MAQVSPPKPWERAGSGGVSSTLPSANGTATAAAPSSSTTSSAAPSIPERPSSLASVTNRNASNYTTSANNTNTLLNSTATSALNRPYGSSPYGYGSYTSPYSRLGSSMYGSGMYGAGSMYGGGMYGGGMYGGGMYGGGSGMYGGGMGAPGDPNNSMTNTFAQSTQATFQMIESIVGAFGGFAQMLESTYMATQSSFFAMVSVAEQFGNLRQTLGQVLGIYTILRWARTLIARLTGRPPPADATALTPANFFAFTGGSGGSPNDPNRPPRPSKKPFIVFLLAAFGLPYLMGKLIKALAKGQEEALAREQQLQIQQQQGAGGVEGINNGQLERTSGLDPSKLDFCRVLYDFPPPEAIANGTFDAGLDLQVKKGDLVAVLDKSEPSGQAANQEGSWWRCRARDGRMGWLPAVYLETIQRKPQQVQQSQPQQQQLLTNGLSQSLPGSRANTMPASVSLSVGKSASPNGSRAQTMRTSTMSSSATKQGKPLARTTDTSKGTGLETFQKDWVNER